MACFSQTILNQAETQTRTVNDPRFVVMAPGFSATSAVTKPFVAKIENTSGGNGNPTNSDAGANNPSGTTTPQNTSFHDTQGNIEVNGGGQLQFTLPIALPPGIKSVAPQINLVYTSGGGNGIAGYGWNISGITAISRIGKNLEKDGEVKGIQLDYSDYYSFNGQRLILKSGEYGKDGAEYVTEKFSNVKIKSLGAVNGQLWQGPEYWEVTFEDGSQAWYGATTTGTSTARTPIEYNIVKWKDAQGNYITYNYTQTHNVATISSIQWGGNETLGKTHFNEIGFQYKSRSVKEQSYVQGISFVQSHLLDILQVKTNGGQFKKYEIVYETKNSYDFVKQVVERNSANEKNNPVEFSYSSDNIQNQELHFDKDMSKADKLYADFDRDNVVDYIEFSDNVVKYKKSVYKDSEPLTLAFDNKFGIDDFKKATTVTFKDSEGFVKSITGIVVPVKISNSSTGKKDYELRVYSVDIKGKRLNYEYSKIIFFDQYHIPDLLDENPVSGCRDKGTIINKINNFDFNGDGLDELNIGFSRNIICNPRPTSPNDPTLVVEARSYLKSVFFNFTADQITDDDFFVYQEIDDPSNNLIPLQRLGDFDGDGIVDILQYGDSTVRGLFNIVKNSTGTFVYKKKESFDVPGIEGLFFNTLFGDFNGDGKTDMLIPKTTKSKDWNLYMSNGKGFTKFSKNNFLYFSGVEERTDEGSHNNFPESGCSFATFTFHEYSTADLDNDGKSEIIVKKMVLRNHLWNAHYDKEYTNLYLDVYANTAGSDGDGNTNFSTIFTKYYNFPNKIIPFGLLTINRDNRELVIIGQPDDCAHNDCNKNYVNNFVFQNIQRYSKISAITQGGITTNVVYKELDPAQTPWLYAPVKAEKYPYMEMDKVSQSYVVSQLLQDNRKQDFLYRGMVAHLQGRGMIGFRQTARSSWYTEDFQNTKIWSAAEMDPLKEGIPLKEWTIKTNNFTDVFPENISESNSQFLSFKETTYRFDKLLNGNLIDVNTILTSDKAKVVSATIPVKSVTKDFVKDIRTESSIEYDPAYYLPIKTTSSINNGFALTTTNLSYLHNPNGTGKDYFIGRPASKNEQIEVYGDTKGAKEEYTYENNLLKSKKSFNRDNSGWFLETYSYDGFGNVIKKINSTSIDNNTTTDIAEYEDKGRFVIQKTDNLGLKTSISYNDWGQILTQTDPFGIVLTNEYDAWGKLLKSKTNLAGTTTYQYQKESNGDVVVTEFSPDGNQKTTFTNRLGQNYKTTAKRLGQGRFMSQSTKFDALGRKIATSEPYTGGTPTQWNSIEYDEFSRPVKATAFTGKIVTTAYNGRTTTVTETNANNRFKKQTTDAVGNIISTEDLGGTIHFSYNAAGENTEANYEGNSVKTSYDVWGNKIRFEDPSNGIYFYEYEGFMGAISKTISPKGEKTYEYNGKGQLVRQKEKSTADQTTDKDIRFSYNDKGLLLQKEGTSLGKYFSSGSTYDNYGRLLSTYEDSNAKYFLQKNITYDDKMRVTSYEKHLLSSGMLTKVGIVNEYDPWSGVLSKVKEKRTGKVLWELFAVDAKGKVLKANLGNTELNNEYDTNGFLSYVQHDSNADHATVLSLGYSFNAIKNELNSRTRGGDFNIIEQFQYDDQNRLYNWTDPVTGAYTQNQQRNLYDNKGRIKSNDQLGTVKFDNTLKKYQPTSMVLNKAGNQNYTNTLIQKILYNENNDPVFIDGEQGDVAFEYGLTSMRQVSYYGGNFQQPTTDNQQPNSKFTKYYSEDGSYEIIRNNKTGKEKHLIYIGGTPYESNIVYLKNDTESSGSFKFLHKDYLGSILAITDEAGKILEQRHYDAWGSFTHLKIGNEAIVTDKEVIRNSSLLIDRGYTSHEHFAEVGIIHMNGRLYDPLLRRFLNADENIQDPHNTQNYNKYGYVLNNPLMYNDPSGEFIFTALAFFLGSKLLAAAVIGAAVGLAAYSVGVLVSNEKWNIGGALKATFFGALGGAASFGIGSLFQVGAVIEAVGEVKFLVQAMAHGVSQGALSAMQGGDFLTGAASGFLGSLGASGFGLIAGEKFAGSLVGNIGFGALAGGVGAELTGGNFWQGAVTGGIVAGLNHAMHSGKSYKDGGDEDGPGPKVQRPSYKRKAFSFSKTQRAYGLSEGLGVFASYTIDGNIIFEGNNITVLASGSTIASSQNNVYFTGEVTISGTSEYAVSSFRKTIPLQKDYSKSFVSNADKYFMGQATFNVPSNITHFNVSVKAGYVFKNSDGLYSIPIPANTTYSQGFKR